jgi:hypothetical protein
VATEIRSPGQSPLYEAFKDQYNDVRNIIILKRGFISWEDREKPHKSSCRSMQLRQQPPRWVRLGIRLFGYDGAGEQITRVFTCTQGVKFEDMIQECERRIVAERIVMAIGVSTR